MPRKDIFTLTIKGHWRETICDLGQVEGNLFCLLFLDIQDCGGDTPESQDSGTTKSDL